MKIRIDRELLSDKLKKTYKFIPSKSIVPAQDNFKFTVTDNVMEIVGADSQCQIKMYCPVKSDGNMAFCLPAQLFLKTVNLFRENEVLITKKSDTIIELKNGKSKCKITMDCFPDDFPMMPVGETKHEISILQYNLKTGIKFADKFVDDEKSARIGAAGINIHEVNNRMVFTGCTDHMICRVNVSPLAIGSWDKNIVMPSETATKLLSLLNDNGEVTMCHNDDKMIFFTDDSIERFEITSTSVNTKFPNSELLFSKKGEDYIVINTLEFKDAFQRLRLYSAEMDKDKRVFISTGQDVNELVLRSSDEQKGRDGEEIISINNPTGKSLSKGFNSASMLKILSSIDSNEMFFFFHESDKMASFIDPKAEGNQEENFNFLISSTS